MDGSQLLGATVDKRLLIAIAIILVVFAGGFGLYRLLFQAGPTLVEPRRAAPDAAAPGPDASQPSRVVVAQVGGIVERRSPSGAWVAVHAGDELSMKDKIRTSEGATVRLEVGETATVEVAPSSEFAVAEMSQGLSRVQLRGGRIEARVYGRTGSRLQVDVLGSDAVAETDKGKFALLRSDDGRVAVTSQEGTVRMSAKGKSVAVKAGQLSLVQPDQPPTAPVDVPASLFLKINRVGASQQTKDLTIRGRTAPGAVVSINGVAAVVGPDGQFKAPVKLAEGENQVAVRSRDVLGREQSQKVQVVVDTKKRDLDGEVDW